MRVDSITNQNPNFGLKKSTKTIFRYAENNHCVSLSVDKPTICGKIVQDTVHFENGKKLKISKSYDKMGELTDKLYYLRDEANKWIKSKVQYFKGGRVVKELRSSRE
jgi:hypothetical protein